MHDEAHVSAQQPPQEEDSRVPRENGHQGRSRSAQAPSPEGPQAPDRLTSRPRQTFPPDVRLRRRREFLHVYEHGVRVPGGLLVLFVLRRAEGGPRLGLTATRKTGGAVIRNRLRRWGREAFRKNREAFGPWDLVVNFRNSAVAGSAAGIERELLALADRARRLLDRQERKP